MVHQITAAKLNLVRNNNIKMGRERVDWINLAKESGKWVAVVNTVMNRTDALIQGKQRH